MTMLNKTDLIVTTHKMPENDLRVCQEGALEVVPKKPPGGRVWMRSTKLHTAGPINQTRKPTDLEVVPRIVSGKNKLTNLNESR